MASIDLEKAFDMVIHTAVFTGLRDIGVHGSDINAIRSLYKEQKAYIQLDPNTRSRYFNVLRGVRQGDPLSPALFTNTVREAMADLRKDRENKGYGTIVGSDLRNKDRMAYAMFADDTTLIAKSKRALAKMLTDIKNKLGSIGLHLNGSKCFIQCSGKQIEPGTQVELNGEKYPICSCSDGFKILGTIVTLDGGVSTEFEARLRAGWAIFSNLSAILRKKDSSEKKRLQLFQATVAKTVLWCAGSWKLSVAQKRKLRSTQRAMLRRMVGPNRRPEEDYITWVRRATSKAEEKARTAGTPCWVERQLKEKWRWAGKTANMERERWARRTTEWRNNDWWNSQAKRTLSCPVRSRAGRFHRWEDEFVSFAQHNHWEEDWFHKANDIQFWASKEDEFIKFAGIRKKS